MLTTYGSSDLYVLTDLYWLAGCLNCIARGPPSFYFPPTLFPVLNKIDRFLDTIFLSIHWNVWCDHMHERCYLTECRIFFFSWPTKYMYGWFCWLIHCIFSPLEVEDAKKTSWIKFVHELGNFLIWIPVTKSKSVAKPTYSYLSWGLAKME